VSSPMIPRSSGRLGHYAWTILTIIVVWSGLAFKERRRAKRTSGDLPERVSPRSHPTLALGAAAAVIGVPIGLIALTWMPLEPGARQHPR
jgi:hypothetical protein